MTRLCVETSIYIEGLCEFHLQHPLVNVGQVAISWKPKYSKPTTILTALVSVRLDTNPLVQNLLCQLPFAVDPLVFLGAEEFWSIDAQKPNADFWHDDTESEFHRYVNAVAIGNLRDDPNVLMWVRPLLKFIGEIRVKTP